VIPKTPPDESFGRRKIRISAFRALGYRNYRLFFTGQSISLIGTWTTRLATSWLVYRLTRSEFLLGLIGFTSQIPTFLLAPIGGVWADRLDRRSVLILTQILLALQTLTMAVLTLSERITLIEIICLSSLQGIINAFEIPSRNAFLVDLVEGREDWGNAIALTYSMDNIARLVGAALAGLTIAAVGEGYCFTIDGISYLAVITSLLMMRINVSAIKRSATGVVEELKEGWTYVSGFIPVRTVLLLFAIVCFIGVPHSVLMPVFAARVLHGGAHTFGSLMAAVGVGALISGIRLATRKSVVGLDTIIAASAALFGVGTIVFSLSRILWLSLLLMVAIGFGMTQQFTASSTVIQTIVPKDKRGRVISYWTVAYMGGVPSGSLLVGGLAHTLGAPRTLMLCGVGCILGALWFWGKRHEMRRLVTPIYQELGIVPAGVASKGSDAT
jgi:MFS family permease